jgi:hypothetical protein
MSVAGWSSSRPEPVEVGSVERPLEWSGYLPVVLPEREQSFAERFEGVEVVGVSALRWTIEK